MLISVAYEDRRLNEHQLPQLTPPKAAVRLGFTNEGGPAPRCFAPTESKKSHWIRGSVITVARR
jgi:hypothetical protein